QPWNSVNIGPHRDIVGTWAKLARKNGLRFGVTVHAARTWDWFDVAHGSDKTGPLAGVPYDGHLTASDGAGQWWQGYDPADLYGPYGAARTPAAHAAYEQKFFNRVMDLTSSYHPDLLYFDDGEPPTSYGLEIAANYYNQNQSWHNGDLQAVLTVKSNEDRIKKAMVLDYERGRSNWTAPEAWQTDTCIGQWHYDVNVFKNHQYKTADQVVKMLIDIVCKNGNLLLNIPLPGDGKPDSDEIQFLRQMASWMRVNGEGIFGTRPWTFPGEGPTRMRGGGFSEGGESRLGPQDFRFTKKGNTLYAFSMGWPTDGRYVIHSLAAGGFGGGSVSGVRLLGSSAKLRWSQTPEGLVVELPTQKPCDYAYCLEIQGLDVAHSQPAPPTIMVPTVKVGTDGTLHLVPHDAMLKGNVQVQSGSLENIGYWDNPDDRVSWKVDFPSAGTYEVTCQVATQGSGTSFVVDAGYGASSPISVPDTGNWDKFVTVTGRVNVGSAGPTTVTFRPAGAIGWKPMNLAGVELRERW
ncbi:MAG TPA: alpha-L-fucosidase, partial [Fimbriimonas sp.]|nr:alpha-L-fucosidase [Fimbriimonas sp.]